MTDTEQKLIIALGLLEECLPHLDIGFLKCRIHSFLGGFERNPVEQELKPILMAEAQAEFNRELTRNFEREPDKWANWKGVSEPE